MGPVGALGAGRYINIAPTKLDGDAAREINTLPRTLARVRQKLGCVTSLFPPWTFHPGTRSSLF